MNCQVIFWWKKKKQNKKKTKQKKQQQKKPILFIDVLSLDLFIISTLKFRFELGNLSNMLAQIGSSPFQCVSNKQKKKKKKMFS